MILENDYGKIMNHKKIIKIMKRTKVRKRKLAMQALKYINQGRISLLSAV